MITINNNKLGNFGFLLDFNQDYLFEFAQLAESNLYMNKRLCATYIRQLTESFFDTIIDYEEITLEDGNNSDIDNRVPGIKEKEIAIIRYFNDKNVRRPEYGKKAFPDYPGSESVKDSRLACPEGEGKNKIGNKLVDPTKSTIFVWDFIRVLGNAGSHAALSEKNAKWLEEKYLIVALEQICNRMRIYFYGRDNKESRAVYSPENSTLSSREILYARDDVTIRRIPEYDILPGYTEQQYFSVMPKIYNQNNGVKWENFINKYTIVRKYKMDKQTNARDYLLQSQKAYLLLQQHGSLDGIAPYRVLADLRNSADYYVTSYEFENEPMDLNEETMSTCGLSENIKKLILLQKSLLGTINNLEKFRIYHRNLTHESIKICYTADRCCQIKLIDFEVVKLFDVEDDVGETVLPYALADSKRVSSQIDKENALRDYSTNYQVNSGLTENDYKNRHKERVSVILKNTLCPRYFRNGYSLNSVTSLEDVISCDNSFFNINESTVEVLKRLYKVFDNLQNSQSYSFKMAEDDLEKML